MRGHRERFPRKIDTLPLDETPLLISVLTRVDWLLFGGIAALVAMGLWAIAGITRYDDPTNPSYFVVHQGMFAAAGGIANIPWWTTKKLGFEAR